MWHKKQNLSLALLAIFYFAAVVQNAMASFDHARYWSDLPAEEISAEGVLHLMVHNRSALWDSNGKFKGKLHSNVSEFGGYKWRLEISDNPGEVPWLNLLFNDGDMPRNKLWFCQLEVMITVLGKSKPGGGTVIATREHKSTHFVTNYTRDFLDTIRMEWIDQKAPLEIIVEVKMAKMPPNLSAHLPALNAELMTIRHDNISESIPVNKEQLTNYSSFFRDLYGNNGQGKPFDLQQEDVEFGIFRDVIYSTLGRHILIDYQPEHTFTLETVLGLAKKYDLVSIFAPVVERDLLKEKNKEKIAKLDSLTMLNLLKLAEQYGMNQLRDFCIEKQDVFVFVTDNHISMENAAAFSKPTLQALQKKVKEYAEEMTNVEQKLGKMMMKQ